MDKLAYLAKTLSRTTRKDYENYVVNAVWNRLGDDTLKPVSQQWLARPDGKGYFIDLYFPQVNLGVECDEPFHHNQKAADRARELDLMDILNQIDANHGYKALHIDISKGYDSVNAQIDMAVEEIRSEAQRRKDAGDFTEWSPDAGDETKLDGRQSISVGDGLSFRTICDVCNEVFDSGYQGQQHAYFRPQGPFRKSYPSYMAWFPTKMAVEGKGRKGWLNIVSPDGSVICEGREGENYEGDGDSSARVVFVMVKDPITGVSGYHFLGVFEPRGTKEVNGQQYRLYRRIAESFPVLRG
jgi:very-short-patch-repair endonuclease